MNLYPSLRLLLEPTQTEVFPPLTMASLACIHMGLGGMGVQLHLGGVGVGHGCLGGMGGDPKTGEFCDWVALAAAAGFAKFSRLWVVSKGWRGWTFVPNFE